MVIQDPGFDAIKPDYAFAIHNLPGFELHQLVLADPVFSAGSIGLEIDLKGKASHAAEPENGINPSMAVSQIIQLFNNVRQMKSKFNAFVLITIIQVILGKKAFGTSPGHAILRATLRAINEKDFQDLVKYAMEEAEKIAGSERLQIKISTTEEFPVTANNPECSDLIKDLARRNDWPVRLLKEPFRWSEDFGHFSKFTKSALVGIGSGMDQPKLHHPDYDFPDEIIPTGINVFYCLYHELLHT
jgi:metal-dependent amidase/aminoacylase/carboxypeptidase family protein